MSTLKLGTIATQDGTESTEVTNVVNGSAKAWINFNGKGTIAIRRDFNVTSIVDNSTGDYTVNFATAMTDANYVVAGAVSTQYDSGVTPRSTISEPTLLNTGSVRISCTYNANTKLDSEVVCISVFS